MEEMDVEKLILLVRDHVAITTPRVVNTETTSYFDDDDDVHNKTTAPLTTVIIFLLLLGLLFKVFMRYFWHGKERQPTFN
jgi:hypothetical protein